MSSTVLVSGGAGFIGRAVVHRLVDDGRQVIVVDKRQPRTGTLDTWPVDSAVSVVFGDVRSPVTWRRAVSQVDSLSAVVHLAAQVGTGYSYAASRHHADVNVVGTACLLDSLLATGVVPERFVLASSRAVYGEGAWLVDGAIVSPPARSRASVVGRGWEPVIGHHGPGMPLPARADWTQTRPASAYGATKLAQESLCEAWAQATGSALSMLRLQNVYGPGQLVTRDEPDVATVFARTAVVGDAIEVFEDGCIVRDFVHIEDVARAFELALRSVETHPYALDIGSGQPTTLLHLGQFLAERCGAPEPIVSGRFRPGDVRAAFCDTALAAERLGYVPSISLDEGMASLVDWIGSAGKGTGSMRRPLWAASDSTVSYPRAAASTV